MRTELRKLIADIYNGDIVEASSRLDPQWTDLELSDVLQSVSNCGVTSMVQSVVHLMRHPRKHAFKACGAAATYGSLDCLKELLPHCDPIAKHNDSLGLAARNGHVDCVQLLIPVSNPAGSNGLQWASRNGHLDCIKELIPVSEPKAIDSFALQLAAKFGHTECVKELLPHSDPERAIRSCIEDGCAESADLIRECLAELQNVQIHTELGTQPDMQPRQARRM
ncbi:ankyrin repeat domain-containing protein [Pseudoxanthomonas winnipegensis]|uniref:ankyrin repeat domain-containing protein n=1 Tax=Pseudoxanthomonas winnipegensis TaxID=2480810 RepID=UPI00104060F5|nr:ankyrin repeat domain-containing protein [Pseudoxanthomonas winnipegensis]TBV69751.1 hypothetical protein EYC45_19065 [Pseudoxanthomonas winnipegensis]